MVRSPGSTWFDSRPAGAVRDFFDLYEQHVDATVATARTLERLGGALPDGSVAERVAGAWARLRIARGGDWQPFEQFLAALGGKYAQDGVPFATWYAVANTFYEAIASHAVRAYGGEPERLIAVLHVIGEYMQRSLSAIATEYFAIRQRLARDAGVRHTDVLDAALDPVIEIDDQGVITEFNRAAEQAFGFRKADALGQSLAALIIPERLRDAHRNAVARYLATGEARVIGRRVELPAQRSDGSEFPIELALVATTGLDGRRRFTGFLRDLSEQQRVAESLALRAHALEQATFGIVISDPVTRAITNVNPAYARMTGYAADELIGSSGTRLIAATSEPDMPVLQRTLAEHGQHTYALHLLRKDGEVLPVLASSSTVATSSGATMRVSTVIDISERDRLERARAAAASALELSARRLEILANSAHEFAAASGDIRALVDLVARRLAEIIGDSCFVRLVSQDGLWLEPSQSVYHRDAHSVGVMRRVLGSERQRIGEAFAGQVAATGVAVLLPEVETAQVVAQSPPEFRTMLTEIGVASVMILPLRSRGRTVGVVSLLRSRPGNPYTVDDQRFAEDLSDRAGLAIDNAMLVATLEQRVAERTATLEAVNRELEAFSYSVSHDLRTPLRAIDGFSRILLDDYAAALDDTGQRYLSRIISGTRRMAQLIDDLLNLGRIARGPLTVADVDLSAIARDVIDEIRRRDPGRVVDVHITPGLSARADARLVTILLENLLGNAWKFTARHAGAAIWFGADAGAFHVRDTGAGFDMAHAGRLFVPFQRMHGADDYDGTGVGLATVHRIVLRHGGRIWADAGVDRGATFFFTLGEQR
jgi:PAS domain S-box-containing protein